ncbi:uncharacterized protein PITG_09920 [Phytophthora infestans T30-4]|uniref:Uncharacterized protein n=1 Tax=Phytophthora infestans (strain T30-4) TaxID=403677 RepID=D0NDU9_PHYIT|nr:uncharacterized protein PITG_09920 [Phytophthora infestans T30-4]EEY56394.1 conserved hypothetical protein [Phytophthora infestans T30-4]|eukprot:XP_002902468.1 conserved hypothetical protein [Phytophthora infestans T30-4]
MPSAYASARVNSAWDREELLHLIEAWEEVVDDPKDRLLLSTGERATLHARFCAISGSNKRSLSSVTRQHHRLCTSYRLIVSTNKKNLKKGALGWFDLSAAEQHELRRVHTKKEKGMTKNVEPEEEADAVDTPKSAWTTRDWALFVDAWQEAVDDFIDYGNEPDEKVKLPNWLIRQKFVALGGPQDTTVGSITAKKRCIIHSYNFIRQCVTQLEELDGSDWFDHTFNERFRLQRKLVSPKSSQRVGCEIDRETYNKIRAVLAKEEVLGRVTVSGHKRKRGQKKPRNASVSSEDSLDSAPRSPSPSPLLEAQNARFEQLMHDLREERMEERKQNQAMLLEILHQRNPPEDPNQNVDFMESLVGKQQEQLMDLFAQMHKERQQEREDFHALLRQLHARS